MSVNDMKSAATTTEAGIPSFSLVVGPEIQQHIEQFLYFEARLLDERRFEEWLKLFSDDTHYWMPVRYNRLLRELDKETAAPGELANFDEDKNSLRQRVVRLGTGQAWAEDPPSRARHLITNIFIEANPAPDEYVVESNFLVYRTRGDSEVDMWVGKRNDVLRQHGPGTYQIARRTILLDQATILSKNLSVFF
jgi:3-phenylpropionate/cinnamic acid dioxygenase small subunit